MAARYRMPIKKSPANDPQQYLVYRMESERIGHCKYAQLTKAQARSLARAVCRRYKIPQVKVQFKSLGGWAAEWQEPNIIILGDKGSSMSLITLTHELAHHLHNQLHPEIDQQSHGPEFVACHMSILDALRMVPIPAMKVVCDLAGVKYADLDASNSWEALKRAVQ